MNPLSMSQVPRFGLALVGTRADNRDFSKGDMTLLRHLLETNRLPGVPSLQEEAYNYRRQDLSSIRFEVLRVRDVPEGLRAQLAKGHDGFALIASEDDNDHPQHLVVLHGNPHGASTPCTIEPRAENPRVIDIRV